MQKPIRWQAAHAAGRLEISMATPAPHPELTFAAVDLLGSGADVRVGPAHQRLSGACADLAPAASMVAFTGFVAEVPHRPPFLFSLAVSLADLPRPEATATDARVTNVALACGAGIRILELTPAAISATYLVPIDAGVLGLAFASPHVDAAGEFTVVFARLAETVAVGASI